MTSSEPALLDPDFEALLREVAANPRSSLLRVERPRMLPELFDERVHVGSQRAGLTSAERQLLQVHRGEVAWLLREACMIKLIEGPRNRRYVSPYSGPGKKVELLSDRQLARRVEESEAASRDSVDHLDGLDLLRRCVADRIGEEPNVAELATASLRLEPSDQARLMVGIGLANGEAPRTAIRVFYRLLADDPPDVYIAAAMESVGRTYAVMGARNEAYEAYNESSRTPQARVWSGLSRLVLAMQLGKTRDVRESALWVSAAIAEDDPSVDWFVGALMEQRRRREWTPTVEAVELAHSLRDSLNEVGRKIADVFV